MLGNDIVDLRDPDTAAGAQHAGFDARVFAPSEFAALSRAPGLRWMLWAAKESAYKAARRRASSAGESLIFSPRRFVVRLDGKLRGDVRHGGLRYPVRVVRAGACVHAIVSSAARESRFIWGLRPIGADRDPSACVRELARQRVAAHLRMDPGELRVERDGRLPQLEFRSGRPTAPLSLSHHGAFVGFACQLDATLRCADDREPMH